jgi:probable HAF family extracellular repeat protein
MRSFCRNILPLLTVLILAAVSTVQADNYTYITIDYGTNGTYLTGINNSGNIAGYTINNGIDQGFIKSGDAYTLLPEGWTVGGINNNNQVVGTYGDAANALFGYIYGGGNTMTFQVGACHLFGLNNSSAIVGNTLSDLGFIITGFTTDIYNNVIPIAIYINSGGVRDAALGINDKGWITGLYEATGNDPFKGYILNGQSYTFLDYPGSNATIANGINNLGQVVGYQDTNGNPNGFFYDGQNYIPIMVPGADATFAQGINDEGQIVGYYEDDSGVHGFLASPAPLPPTLLLFGSGLLGLAGLRRFKKN